MSVGLDDNTCGILREPLKIYHRKGSGGSYPYVKGEDVIRQLNKAFKHTWSSEVIKAEEKHGHVLVLVALNVFFEGDNITHHGYGSAPIATKRGSNEVIDIGNNYKSAYTSAVKKAAEQFGIGLGGEAESISPSAEHSAPSSPPPTQRFSPPTSGTMSKSPSSITEPAPLQPRTDNGFAKPAGRGPGRPSAAPKPATAPTVVPSGDEGELLNSTQETALESLSSMRGVDRDVLIKLALNEGNNGTPTTKTSFGQLTKNEAIKVIRYANKLPQG